MKSFIVLMCIVSVSSLAQATEAEVGKSIPQFDLADSKEMSFRDEDHIANAQTSAMRSHRDSVDSQSDRGDHGDYDGLGGGSERD